MCHATFKYNLIPHSSTNQTSSRIWHRNLIKPPLLLPFGCISSAITTNHKPNKLHIKSTTCRLLANLPNQQLLIITILDSKHAIRNFYFLPYNPQIDPARLVGLTNRFIHEAQVVFDNHVSTHHTTNSTSSSTLVPSRFVKKGRFFHDAKVWAIGHHSKIDQLDDQHAIDWLLPRECSKNIKPLLQTMNYKYFTDGNGNFTCIKTSCFFRGDLMRLKVHFDLKHTASYAIKNVIRILSASLAQIENNQIPHHFDLTFASTTKLQARQNEYVRQIPY